MGLVEFEKRGGSEIALKVERDKIIFTKNWPAEAIKVMRKMGLKENDEDWAKLYRILMLMYQTLKEGETLVQIAYDRKFVVEGTRIEAVSGHFAKLIDLLRQRSELFAHLGHSEMHRQMVELLIALRKESEEE